MPRPEEWKDIPGYEGLYQASTYGRVKRLSHYIQRNGRAALLKELILKPERCKSTGYLYVNLSSGGHVQHCTVHRLIALTFIPNPDELPQVNHRDEQRTNNAVDNLEWCDQTYNTHYGACISKISTAKMGSKTGPSNPFYGKHHTPETRAKISATMKKRRAT